MKTEKNVWEIFIGRETVKNAILNAARGKRKYRKVRKILADIDGYTDKLCELLRDNLYVPSPYVTETMKTEYGKEREIFKLPFYPDRCVQHAISIVLRPRWTRSFTADTYACIVGRGINCKDTRYNLNRKVKRALYKTRTCGKLYCLKMDISKCYPSTDNLVLAKLNRKYCSDEKMLALLDLINFTGDGLPIGNFISQLWINIVLTELDRFVKEVLKVKYYFRYMDDIVIFHDEKSVLHEWQWRIMNFCWYKLHFLMNSKRQIFPVGTNRTERGNDFGGYVFRRKYTLIRKRIKKSFARNRHKPKSVTSYKGLVMHCNGRNLVNKIINKNNMNLSELGLKRIERPFEGDSIKIEAVIDKPIEILDFEIRPSEKKPNTDYLKLQVKYEGRKRFIGGGYQFLCEVLRQVDKKDLPLETIIRNKRGYYFDGTIDE